MPELDGGSREIYSKWLEQIDAAESLGFDSLWVTEHHFRHFGGQISYAASAEETAQGGQSLEQAASDPTASLMSVQIQNLYPGDYHNLHGQEGNTILLRSAIPFKTGSLDHIARATLPIVTDSPSGKNGLSDLVLFDLIVFNVSWRRWGSGACHAVSDRNER